MTLQELYEATKTDLENGYDPKTPVVVDITNVRDNYAVVLDAYECYFLDGRYWINVT